MNYYAIKPVSIENGPGIRVSLFVSGCNIHCKNCHNPELWDFNAGKPFDETTMDELCSYLDKDYVKGLSILGGEPLDERNVKEVTDIVQFIRDAYGISKDIWLYTGYPYDKVKHLKVMKYIDVLVDGPYIDEYRDISLAFRGSYNQLILNLKGGETIIE